MYNTLKAKLFDLQRERIINYLETLQDFIVILLCVGLFTAMVIRVGELFFSLVHPVQFQLVTADILFVLIMLELFRLLIIYLQKRQISVAVAVEVSIVSILREVIVRGVLELRDVQIIAVGILLIILGGMLLIPTLEEHITQKIEQSMETKHVLEAERQSARRANSQPSPLSQGNVLEIAAAREEEVHNIIKHKGS